MANFHKKAEEFWIQAAREPGIDGALAFIYFVSGFKPEDFHIDWLKQFFSQLNRNQVIVAPRGSAKTTYLCLALAKYIADNPWDANALLSVTATQAKARLAYVHDIMTSERFQKIYPWIKIDSNRPDTQYQFSAWDTRFTYPSWRSEISHLGGDSKSPTLLVGGAGGRGVIGSRVTGVLALDDVSDHLNAGTQELRDQLWMWLTTVVLPILSGNHTRIWSIGTRWADGDVISHQIETGEYEHSEIKAINKDNKGRLKSYWPKLFSFKTLLKILNQGGKTAFILAYMNNITALKGAIFTADMLRTDFPRDDFGRPVFPEFDKIVISVDAAITAKQASDESALAVLGIKQSPNTGLPQMWVLAMQHGHWKNMQVLENIEITWLSTLNRYKAKDYSVLIETVAGQQLFLTLMEQKKDFSVPQRYIDTYAPVSDKGTRARSTATAGERGDLLVDIKADWYAKWFSQCIEFTGEKGNADDLVDVMTQVGVREFGDINSYAIFNPSYTSTVVPGLTL